MDAPLLDYIESKRLRDAGMQLATSASDPFEFERCCDHVRDIARRLPTFFVDDVRLDFPTTLRPNAWGSVWRTLIREGCIERTNERRCTSLIGKHCHDYPVYRSLIYVGE